MSLLSERDWAALQALAHGPMDTMMVGGAYARGMIRVLEEAERRLQVAEGLNERAAALLPKLSPAHYPGKDGRDTEAQGDEQRALIADLAKAVRR